MALFYSIIANSSDPYMACHNLVEDHPHYRDCENCQNNSWCDIATLDKALKEGLKAQAMAQELLKQFEPKRKCKLP